MIKLTPASVQDWIDKISVGHTQVTAFYFITNADGTTRWIWPAANKTPIFLKLYSATTLRAKLYVMFIKMLFVLRLQSLYAKKDISNFDEFPSSINVQPGSEWALFTGTVGPNRKMILVGNNTNEETTFTKIAVTAQATMLVQNEAKSITYLDAKNLKSTIFPTVVSKSQNHIQLSDVSGGKRSTVLTDKHIQSLLEIQNTTAFESIVGKTLIYKETLDTYRELSTNQNNRIPKAMKRKLQWLISDINEGLTIKQALAHKDYTPWNCFVNEDSVALYDLELAQDKLPVGFDAFHFIIQNGILVNRQSWKEIYKEITSVVCPAFFDNDEATMKEYLKLYLLINITYYLDIYSKQNQWHTQIHWLLNTWNDALSYILSEVNNPRKLVLMDTFDFMQNRQYAALKFKGYLPEQISEYSDVDLCTTKEDADALVEYLRNHSLVHIARCKKLSFMSNIELVLNSSELLSVDCIWQLKRKNLVIQNIAELIEGTTTNVFGVKQPNALAQSEYVNRFYTMNKAITPMEYKSASFELELENMAQSSDPYVIQKTFKKQLQTKTENQRLSFVRNSLNYIIDSFKNLISQRGFIVTFSGVDGAGKSTLIEITKKRIDKQLRKPVVVLRHRPSLLPILSAWTMGKQAAEENAASTLPRQGNNKNTLSSIARFGYYYLDYILGQFYIYIKYVLRGKVVLYDRYYFDFINDSRRSNINLPTWFTTLGYKLIMKPHVNFFLYADAETILARKQELDADTIRTLTSKYLDLFKKLEKAEDKNSYVPIKNIDLSTTINTIMNRLIGQVA